MTDILGDAKSHFRERMTGGLSKLEVPEWADSSGKAPFIYYRPSMTMKEQGEIQKFVNDNKQAEAVVMALIIRARDENGDKLFRRANMTEMLNQIDPDVLTRIVTDMSSDDLDVDDAIKN